MRSKSKGRDKRVRLQCLAFEDRITPAVLFNTATPYQITNLNNNNGSVATADFNHDGFMDAVLTDIGTDFGSGAGTQIIVLYGNASGGFGRVTLQTGGSNVSYVAAGDINGDGWADLVVSNENHQNAGSISIFRNDGAGNLSLFNGTTISSFSNNPAWVGLADVTGDNVPDLVVASFGKDDGSGNNLVGNNMTIFQANVDGSGHGNFTFSGTPTTTLNPSVQFIPTSAAVADFDGDGINDIAAAVPGVPADSGDPQSPGSIYLFKGTGGGGFSQPNQIDSGGKLPVSIQAVDLNNDNRKDLLISNAGDPNSTSPEWSGNAVAVALNVGSPGNLSFGLTNSITTNCYGTFAATTADFNLDGKIDIAAVNYGTRTGFSPVAFVAIYLGTGTGAFNPPVSPTPGTYNLGTNGINSFPGGQCLAVGDFDHNGTPDIIAGQASFYVGILLNASTAAAAPHVAATQVNDGSIQRSRVTSLKVTFDLQVTFTNNDPTSAFTLTRNGGGSVTFVAHASVMNNVTVVTLDTFSGNETDFASLNDGRYTLTALASRISANGQQLGGGTGTNYTYGDSQGLYRMFGDFNADRQVDIADLTPFAGSFGLVTGQSGFLGAFDYNGDGSVDVFDLNRFAARFGTVLGP